MGWKHVPLDSFHWICDYNFLGCVRACVCSETFSMTRPILLLTSETPVRLSWLTETSPFTSVMGANLNRANTAACNCTLSTGEDCDCEAALASECITSAVAAGDFRLWSHCQTNMHCWVMHTIFIKLLSDQLYPRWRGAYETYNIILCNGIILLEVASYLHYSAANSVETFR